MREPFKAKLAALDEAGARAESALGGHLKARIKPKEAAAPESPAPAEGAAADVAELKPLLEQLIGLLGGEAQHEAAEEMGGGMMGKGGMMGGASGMGG